MNLQRPALLLLSSVLLSFSPPARAAEPLKRMEHDLGGGVTLETVVIPAGTYLQGSPPEEPQRDARTETRRQVTLTRDFQLGVTPVTRGQWKRFVESTGYRTEAETGRSGGFGWTGGPELAQRPEFTWKNPGFPQNDDHPVVIVTVKDAKEFLKWLSGVTGYTFTLPTEAQWEYACRAGTTTAWWPGDDEARAKRYIWSKETAGNGTRSAWSRPPNDFGLHIAGNVQEWCEDVFAPYNPVPVIDPVRTAAPAGERSRAVLRGGGWLRPLKEARSAARWRNDPGSRNADNGFRVMSFGLPADAAPQTPTPPVPPRPAANTINEVQPSQPEPRPPSQNRRRVVTPQPDPAENPAHPAALSPGSQREGGVSWLWLLLGIGILLWIVRRLKGKKGGADSRPPLPYGLDEKPKAPAVTPGTFVVKPGADGFWLLAGYEAGTWLQLHWREGEGGYHRERRVQYEPGPEGQFIYTGLAPEDIRVTAEDDDKQDGDDSRGAPPQPPRRPSTGFRRHDPPSPPPFPGGGGGYRPSAY